MGEASTDSTALRLLGRANSEGTVAEEHIMLMSLVTFMIYVYIYIYTYIPAPSKGCQLNPKGW